MSASARHEAHDRLLADVRLMNKRLTALGERVGELDPETRATLPEEHEELVERCGAMIDEITSWTEVEVGVPTAVADLSDAVDAIEADLDAREPVDASSYELAVDRQVRAWRARLDRLRLQSALGTMEARDDLLDLGHRLDRARGDVLVELQEAAGDTKAMVADLREEVEDVLGDIRQSVRKAVRDLSER